MGADIKVVKDSSEQKRVMENIFKDLRSRGRRPYITGVDDYDLSALAYVECMLEMCSQLQEIGIEPDYFLCFFGGKHSSWHVSCCPVSWNKSKDNRDFSYEENWQELEMF